MKPLRLINQNIPTIEVPETTGALYVPEGNRGRRYKVLEVIQDAQTSAHTLKKGDRLYVKFTSGVDVLHDGHKITIVNEGEILSII